MTRTTGGRPGRFANSVLRFALELTALASLGAWGWHAGGAQPQRLLAACALPLVAATAWGQFVAPRAPRYLGRAGRLVVEGLLFGGAGLALVDLGRPRLAAVVVLLAVVNTALVHLWRQDELARKGAAAR